VAVNKLDAAEPPWDQARFEGIKGQLQPFLELAGFKADKIRSVLA
jgi:translation elongation factor EF-1alpha